MSQSQQPFDVTGKVAVITGAASGIGEATAKVLAGAGAQVVCADLDEGGTRKTAEAIGDAAIAVACNVAKKADVDAAVDAAVERFGRLDAMCNIAGIPLDRFISEATEEELDRIIAVNQKGVFYGCQAAVRVMTAPGGGTGGSIVNVTSSGIDAPAKRYGLYAMTKAAVAMLTKSLAVEVGRFGIRVNAIAPGATITPFTERHLVGPDGEMNTEYYEQFVEAMKKQSPLGIVGDPVDQAYLIQYLISDAARFCTGAIWRANGGQTFSW